MRIYCSGNNVTDWFNGDDSLHDFLLSVGHELEKSVAAQTDVVLFLNWSRRCLRDLERAERLGISTVLVMTEPSVVIPAYRDSQLMNRFSAKLEFGRASSAIPYPQRIHLQYFSRENRLDSVVAVAGNKISYVRGELYSLRIDAFSKVDGITLYGAGWKTHLRHQLTTHLKEFVIALSSRQGISLNGLRHLLIPRSLRVASVSKKHEAMSRFKYALVIENSEEYVSEKLLDAVMAGCIPIYVGGMPEVFGVPEELFVRCAPSLKNIRDGIAKAAKLDYKEWRSAARNFLTTPSVSRLRTRKEANMQILRTIVDVVDC